MAKIRGDPPNRGGPPIATAPQYPIAETLHLTVPENARPKFRPRWRCTCEERAVSNGTRSWDVYYFSPGGAKFRSKAAVARELGLEPPTRGGRGRKAADDDDDDEPPPKSRPPPLDEEEEIFSVDALLARRPAPKGGRGVEYLVRWEARRRDSIFRDSAAILRRRRPPHPLPPRAGLRPRRRPVGARGEHPRQVARPRIRGGALEAAAAHRRLARPAGGEDGGGSGAEKAREGGGGPQARGAQRRRWRAAAAAEPLAARGARRRRRPPRGAERRAHVVGREAVAAAAAVPLRDG